MLLSRFVHGFMVYAPILSPVAYSFSSRWHRTPALVVGAEGIVQDSGALQVESRMEQAPTIINSTLRPKIQKLNSEKDFRSFLDEDDRLCLIKFYAPYCKSCQKFGVQYNRIGKEIGDLTTTNQVDGSKMAEVRKGEIRLAEMEYGANKELCQRLGVTKLPTIHFYSRGKLVEGFPCGPRKIAILLDKLSRYRSMSASELAFEAEMNKGMALGDMVIESLDMDVSSRKVIKDAMC